MQKGQKQELSEFCGTLVGGNIRCLLKLAGTEYWPDMQDKILLLESWSGGVPKMVTYFSQLRQLGVFRQIKALILGTFTEMEDRGCSPTIEELVCRYAGSELPILKTRQIGHGKDALAVRVGEKFGM